MQATRAELSMGEVDWFGQLTHANEPVSEYVSRGQLVHDTFPIDPLYVPAPHAVQLVVPAYPALHVIIATHRPEFGPL